MKCSYSEIHVSEVKVPLAASDAVILTTLSYSGARDAKSESASLSLYILQLRSALDSHLRREWVVSFSLNCFSIGTYIRGSKKGRLLVHRFH
jgi:hypothetical protein